MTGIIHRSVSRSRTKQVGIEVEISAIRKPASGYFSKGFGDDNL